MKKYETVTDTESPYPDLVYYVVEGTSYVISNAKNEETTNYIDLDNWYVWNAGERLLGPIKDLNAAKIALEMLY
jgi:hypothetical protein